MPKGSRCEAGRFFPAFRRRDRMEPYPWAAAVKELDASALYRGNHLRQRRGAGADLAFKGLHAADGADGDTCPAGKLRLLPSHQRTAIPRLWVVCRESTRPGNM